MIKIVTDTFSNELDDNKLDIEYIITSIEEHYVTTSVNHDKKPLIINHPMVDMDIINDDSYIIEEPIAATMIMDTYFKHMFLSDYIVITSLESYFITEDNIILESQLLLLESLLVNLDDLFTEVFLVLPEEILEKNKIFDQYQD